MIQNLPIALPSLIIIANGQSVFIFAKKETVISFFSKHKVGLLLTVIVSFTPSNLKQVPDTHSFTLASPEVDVAGLAKL